MPKQAKRRPSPVDYAVAKTQLEQEFERVEVQVLNGQEPALPEELAQHFDTVFRSSTQGYREVFLGCVLARLNNPSTDIRKPYMKHGENAYNGRTLSEKIVTPFLEEKRIPCSKAPFLSTFRRGVQFVEATRIGVKDEAAFSSFLALVHHVAAETDNEKLLYVLRYLLLRFIRLRTATDVPLSRLHRISLEQYGLLIEGLLSTQSGGRFPLMLAEVTFTAIKVAYNLDWTIEVQGINVADRSSGAGGDITVKQGTAILIAAEVTERPIEKSRIISTFQTKIAPQGIEDYLFLVRDEPDEEVMRQARQYFSQGHEVNFLEIKNWILVIPATIGKTGRAVFNEVLLEKLNASDIPAALKDAWNKQVERITSV